jgi:dolichyl-phosphate beta-glucosyltransferase
MLPFAIIIPCFNEASRLPIGKFKEFLNKYKAVQFIFVDDGSKDDTANLLKQLQQEYEQIIIIKLVVNKGKGEAVRQGIIKANIVGSEYIGYLDADLSTSLDDFYDLYLLAKDNNLDIVLGSRIQKIDTRIERSFTRHIIGRTLATIIDNRFKLGIYDTQCGAKIFNRSILNEISDQPYKTKWFFDVEIIRRINQKNNSYRAMEIPLKLWKNGKHSKISIFSLPVIVNDLYILLTKC